MKNKTLPAILAVTVLLFILTALTIVFVGDYYSAYGKYGDNGSLYDGRSPIYSTKAMDTEAVQYSIERTKALQEFNVIGSDDISTFDYELSRYSLPEAEKSAVAGSTGPNRYERVDPEGGAEANTEILYVIYSESLTESGGY